MPREPVDSRRLLEPRLFLLSPHQPTHRKRGAEVMKKHNQFCTCWRCFIRSPHFLVSVYFALVVLCFLITNAVETYPSGGLCGWPIKACPVKPQVPICAWIYEDRHVEYKPCSIKKIN
jgi:hypothetical protein